MNISKQFPFERKTFTNSFIPCFHGEKNQIFMYEQNFVLVRPDYREFLPKLFKKFIRFQKPQNWEEMVNISLKIQQSQALHKNKESSTKTRQQHNCKQKTAKN